MQLLALVVSQYGSPPGKSDFRNELKAQSLGNVCLTRAIEVNLPPLHVATQTVRVFQSFSFDVDPQTNTLLFLKKSEEKLPPINRISPNFSSLHAVSAPKNLLSSNSHFSFVVTNRTLLLLRLVFIQTILAARKFLAKREREQKKFIFFL